MSLTDWKGALRISISPPTSKSRLDLTVVGSRFGLKRRMLNIASTSVPSPKASFRELARSDKS